MAETPPIATWQRFRQHHAITNPRSTPAQAARAWREYKDKTSTPIPTQPIQEYTLTSLPSDLGRLILAYLPLSALRSLLTTCKYTSRLSKTMVGALRPRLPTQEVQDHFERAIDSDAPVDIVVIDEVDTLQITVFQRGRRYEFAIPHLGESERGRATNQDLIGFQLPPGTYDPFLMMRVMRMVALDGNVDLDRYAASLVIRHHVRTTLLPYLVPLMGDSASRVFDESACSTTLELLPVIPEDCEDRQQAVDAYVQHRDALELVVGLWMHTDTASRLADVVMCYTSDPEDDDEEALERSVRLLLGSLMDQYRCIR